MMRSVLAHLALASRPHYKEYGHRLQKMLLRMRTFGCMFRFHQFVFGSPFLAVLAVKGLKCIRILSICPNSYGFCILFKS